MKLTPETDRVAEDLEGDEAECRHGFTCMTQTGVRCMACWERVPPKQYWEAMPRRFPTRAAAEAAVVSFERKSRPFFIWRARELENGRWQVERGFRT